MSRIFVFGAVAIVVILVIIYVMIQDSRKSKGVPDFIEGEVVRCPKTGGIYRIVNGMKSWYPSEAVWRKRGSLTPREVDCSSLDSIQSGPNIEHMI